MARLYGYCRISTMKQNIQRQIENIKTKYPKAVIITEEYTGTTTDRPAWSKLAKQLKEGDTVVFDEVSRMSRNAAEGFALYQDLFQRGVHLVFLKEPHINTDVYRGGLQRFQHTGESVVEHLALMRLEQQELYAQAKRFLNDRLNNDKGKEQKTVSE